ncbi:MAG: hypothetical protein LBG90_01135 [Spirochaetaceae bacterium]|jgi:hypothetical protein|nr:hypothetical protein [Spirochaetaceae bacterium]
MDFIKGITFAPFARRGVLGTAGARESLKLLVSRTNASHIILTPAGLQDTPHSEKIDFSGEETPSDEELISIIKYARELGIKVILKPTVNCKDGTWRAYINFFDKEVPCEPKWSAWFASHERFQLRYAELAEKTGCVMFILGCEMVCAERREQEWRDLIAKTKSVYSGLVSYNTDKYQEDRVSWWDSIDVISSSGYYPVGSWEAELNRIERVVTLFNKPFFFAETGCMSVRGSSQIPNDWTLNAPPAPEEQAAWYREMFEATKQRPWAQGYGLWSWAGIQAYSEEEALVHKGYDIYAKPAEKVVKAYFSGYSRQRDTFDDEHKNYF